MTTDPDFAEKIKKSKMARLRGKIYVLIENYGIFFHKIGVHMIFCLKIDHFWNGPPH